MNLDEVKIRDFVKSKAGKFTQVYGFGHLDPSQFVAFLQIYFGSNNRTKTSIITLF